MSIQSYYADRENCFAEIRLAREIWGSTESTFEEWEGVQSGLGFMVLYCPEDIHTTVCATLMELSERRALLESAGRFPRPN